MEKHKKPEKIEDIDNLNSQENINQEDNENKTNLENFDQEFQELETWSKKELDNLDKEIQKDLTKIENDSNLPEEKIENIKKDLSVLDKLKKIRKDLSEKFNQRKIKKLLKILAIASIGLSGGRELYSTDKNTNSIEQNIPGKPISQRDDFDGSAPISKVGLKLAELEAKGTVFFEEGVNDQDPYGDLFDLYRYYFGQELESDALSISEYKPGDSKDESMRYVSINDKAFLDDVLKEYRELEKPLAIGESAFVSGYTKDKVVKNNTTSALGNYRIGHGQDEKGEYVSYYDTFKKQSGKVGDDNLIGSQTMDKVIGAKQFEVYGRIYL